MAEANKKDDKKEEKKNDGKKLTFWETCFTKPFKQMREPGLGNVVDGGFGLAGRVGVGYGTYRLVRKGIEYLAK